MITTTWGAGGVHASLTAAMTWLGGLGNLADDYTLEQVGNSVETGLPWNNNYNGHRLYVTCPWNEAHRDNHTVWYRTQLNKNFDFAFAVNPHAVGGDDPDGFSVSWLYVIRIQKNDDAAAHRLLRFWNTYNSYCEADNCCLEGWSTTDDDIGWYTTGFNPLQRFANLKVWNCEWGAQLTGGDQTSPVCENISIYGCGRGIVMDSTGANTVLCRNVVACGSTGAGDYYRHFANYCDFENCADSDGTIPDAYATGTRHNINTAVEFQSLNDANQYFLWLRDAELDLQAEGIPDIDPAVLRTRLDANPRYVSLSVDLAYNGVAALYSTEDMTGMPRPDVYGNTSIGCHEPPIAAAFYGGKQRYIWGFGDGGEARGKTHHHAYIPGVWKPAVTAVNAAGYGGTAKVRLEAGPFVDIVVPREGYAPLLTQCRV